MDFFNNVHMTAAENGFPLVFVESERVQVYPCGKRRAKISNDNANDYMPFDPESRLNTEANNRKHVGKNGFTQTYLGNSSLVDENDNLILVLDGYYFTIDMAGPDPMTAVKFAKAFESAVQADRKDTSNGDTAGYDPNFSLDTATKIYANIRVEYVDLFIQEELGLAYQTTALRKQSAANVACLDIYNNYIPEDSSLAEASQNTANYYFSGLSFSTMPLDELDKSITDYYSVSLCILEKRDGTWQVCQKSLLPNITHGDSENSVVVGDIEASGDIEAGGDVKASSIVANDIKLSFVREGESAPSFNSVPSLELLKRGSSYKLHFSAATIRDEST